LNANSVVPLIEQTGRRVRMVHAGTVVVHAIDSTLADAGHPQRLLPPTPSSGPAGFLP